MAQRNLTPLPDLRSTRARLIAEGKLIPGRGNLAQLPRPPHGPGGTALSHALDEVRQDRI